MYFMSILKLLSKYLLPALLFAVFSLLSFPPLNFNLLAYVMFVPILVSMKYYSNIGKMNFILPVIYGGISGSLIVLQLFYYPIFDPFQDNKIYYVAFLYFALYFSFLFISWRAIQKKMSRFAILVIPLYTILFEEIINSIPMLFPLYATLSLSVGSNVLNAIRLIGIQGCAALIVLVNSLIASTVFLFMGHEKKLFRLPQYISLLTVLLLTFQFNTTFPLFSQGKNKKPEAAISISYLQAAIPQWQFSYLPYSTTTQKKIAGTYFKMLNTVKNADCVVLPESAIVGSFKQTKVQIDTLKTWAKKNDTALIVNSMYRTSKIGETNAALHIAANGKIVNTYGKMNLVLFNESGRFTQGNSIKTFTIQNKKAGILICFDGLFAHMYNRLKKAGADFIISLNNDTAAGLSSVPHLHFAYSRIYAAHYDIPIIHVSQAGCSGTALPDGSVAGYLPPYKNDISRVIMY